MPPLPSAARRRGVPVPDTCLVTPPLSPSAPAQARPETERAAPLVKPETLRLGAATCSPVDSASTPPLLSLRGVGCEPTLPRPRRLRLATLTLLAVASNSASSAAPMLVWRE